MARFGTVCAALRIAAASVRHSRRGRMVRWRVRLIDIRPLERRAADQERAEGWSSRRAKRAKAKEGGRWTGWQAGRQAGG